MQRHILTLRLFALIFGSWLLFAHNGVVAAAEANVSQMATSAPFTLSHVWFAATGLALVFLLITMYISNRRAPAPPQL